MSAIADEEPTDVASKRSSRMAMWIQDVESEHQPARLLLNRSYF